MTNDTTKIIRRVSLYLFIAFLLMSAVLILFRIGFRFFGANPLTPFVAFTYGVTEILLIPFLQIFPTPEITQEAQIDFVGITGFITYLILVPVAWMFIALITKSVNVDTSKKKKSDVLEN